MASLMNYRRRLHHSWRERFTSFALSLYSILKIADFFYCVCADRNSRKNFCGKSKYKTFSFNSIFCTNQSTMSHLLNFSREFVAHIVRILDFIKSTLRKIYYNNVESTNTKSNYIRAVVGRGPSYYQRYGTACIAIPINSLGEFSFKWQIKAIKPRDRLNFGCKKMMMNNKIECTFCKNIHRLKNCQNVFTCPVLCEYQFSLCFNTNGNDFIRTVQYYSQKQLKIVEDYKRRKNDGKVFLNNQAFPRQNVDRFYRSNMASLNRNGSHFPPISMFSSFVNKYGKPI